MLVVNHFIYDVVKLLHNLATLLGVALLDELQLSACRALFSAHAHLSRNIVTLLRRVETVLIVLLCGRLSVHVFVD